MRRIKTIALLFIMVLAAWWLLSRWQVIPSWGNLFKERPVRIENSPLLIKEIKSLAQLVTVSAYDELVVDSTIPPIPRSAIPALIAPVVSPINEAFGKRIVVIGKVTTHAGIDLEQLGNEALRVTGDSVYLLLPPARLLDTIINPSGVEIFIEKGAWDNQVLAQLKNKLKTMAAVNGENRGLLRQAERKAEEVLSTFFKAIGYKKVKIDFRRPL